MTTRTVTSPGCLDGMVMWPGDFDPEPPAAYLCPDCRRDEDHCLATKHATGTACCDPCEARAKVCPSLRHACPGELTGLVLATHTSGACKCRGRA